MPRIADYPTRRLGGGARRRRVVLICFGVMVLLTMLVTLVLFGALSGHGDGISSNSAARLFGRPTFSIIIPSQNDVVYLSNTLHALGSDLKQVGARHEIILVEVEASSGYSSDDGLKSLVGRLEGSLPITLLRNARSTTLTISEAMELGLAEASGEYLVFMHDNVEVLSGFFRAVLRGFQSERHVTVVAPRLLFPDGTLYDCGVDIELGRVKRGSTYSLPQRSGPNLRPIRRAV